MVNKPQSRQRDDSDDGGSSNNRPWGDAKAPVPKPGGRQGEEVWITLGPVWETQSGGYSFVIEAEPIGWRDARVPRRVVIIKRQERDE